MLARPSAPRSLLSPAPTSPNPPHADASFAVSQECCARQGDENPRTASVTFDAAERDFMMTVPDKVHAQDLSDRTHLRDDAPQAAGCRSRASDPRASLPTKIERRRRVQRGEPLDEIPSARNRRAAAAAAAARRSSHLRTFASGEVPFALPHFNAILLLHVQRVLPRRRDRRVHSQRLDVGGHDADAPTGGFSALWLVANELRGPVRDGRQRHADDGIPQTLLRAPGADARPRVVDARRPMDQRRQHGGGQKKGEQPRKTIRRRSAEPSELSKMGGADGFALRHPRPRRRRSRWRR